MLLVFVQLCATAGQTLIVPVVEMIPVDFVWIFVEISKNFHVLMGSLCGGYECNYNMLWNTSCGGCDRLSSYHKTQLAFRREF